MSLLDRGTETVVVYPEEVTTDADGNTITRASATGVVKGRRPTSRPSGRGARRRVPIGDSVEAPSGRLAGRSARCSKQGRVAGPDVLPARRADAVQRLPAYRSRRLRDGEALAHVLFQILNAASQVSTTSSSHTKTPSKSVSPCWASIRLHTEWSLKAIVSIPRSLPLFVVGEEGVKVESPQRSEENRP